MNKEIWKDIKDYEGLYQISNLGNVKSLSKRVYSGGNRTRILKEKVLKPNIRNGYYVINLRKNNNRVSKQVHRLVTEAFILNPQNKPFVNHKDFNKLNNKLENLEWCTQKENVRWSICNMKHRHKTNNSNTGEQYIYYRKTTNKYRVIIDRKEYVNCKTLQEAINYKNKILGELNQ